MTESKDFNKVKFDKLLKRFPEAERPKVKREIEYLARTAKDGLSLCVETWKGHKEEIKSLAEAASLTMPFITSTVASLMLSYANKLCDGDAEKVAVVLEDLQNMVRTTLKNRSN